MAYRVEFMRITSNGTGDPTGARHQAAAQAVPQVTSALPAQRGTQESGHGSAASSTGSSSVPPAGGAGGEGSRRPAWHLLAAAVVPVLGWWVLWGGAPAGKEPFGLRFTVATSAVCALALVALVLVAVHLLLIAGSTAVDPRRSAVTPEERVAWRHRGLKAAVMGEDGRASTSKAQAALWTVVVLFAAVFLFLLGRSPNCGGRSLPTGSSGWLWSSCPRGPAVEPFDVLFVSEPAGALPLLLGLPIAAAVFAKASAEARERRRGASGTTKDAAPAEGVGVSAGLGEVVSNDHGDLDLLDAQYAAFTLLLVLLFLVQLLSRPLDGLPALPETLLVLSGVTTGSYAVKKHLQNTDEVPR